MMERVSAMAQATLRRGALVMLGIAMLMGPVSEARGQSPMSWSEFRALPSVEADQRVEYGPGPHGWGELYLPEGGGPHPVALVVHGGCWQSMADVGYMSRFSRFLAEAGWAVWAPEFRRIDQSDSDWPAILEDVAASADHLRVMAGEFDLDLDRVVSLGHSSGGHLALWLAGRSALPPDEVSGFALRGDAPLPIRAVVGLAAIADLEEFDDRPERGCGRDIVSRLVAGNPEGLDERLRLTSPESALPLGVPQLLLTGGLDGTVPTAHGAAWVRAATEAGDVAELLDVPGAGHFELVAPWDPRFASMWPTVQAFLDAIGTDGERVP